jgi:hypothetical protein
MLSGIIRAGLLWCVWAGLCAFIAASDVEAAPKAVPNVIFRPSFLTEDFAHYAGMAFRLKEERSGRHFLVTAHSLFGPAADLDVQMSDEDIARVVVAAVGVSCTDPRVLVLSRRHVSVAGARRADERGAEKDITLFELPAGGPAVPALSLDEAVPVRGDKGWLYVKHADTRRVRLEPVVLAWVSEREIRYFLTDQQADLRGTTGAPILSETGKVLGMHLGVFTSRMGRNFGYAVPAGALADELMPGRAKPVSVLR